MIKKANVATVATITCFVFIIIVLSVHYMKSSGTSINVNVGGMEYGVVNDKHSSAGAMILFNVETKLREFIKYMSDKYEYNPKVIRMKDRMKETQFIESVSSTYNQNKGEKIVMCIRQADSADFYDHNTLMFVALHEAAHAYSSSIGHGDEFWRNFKFILTEAVKAGIYTAVDYSAYPVKYCGGKMITDSPLFVGDLRSPKPPA